MTGIGRAWRVLALLVGAGLVCYGSVRGGDGNWPFAPMSQFAFSVARDGQIRSTYITAQSTDGSVQRVVLNVGEVGLTRSEIEGQLPRFVRDPSLLQAVADGHARLHPDRPGFTELWLHQSVTVLRAGRPAGQYDELLAGWRVPDAG